MSVPASDVATTSHKRTSSAAENIIIAPSNKRRVEEPTESAAKSTPQFVYVVVVDSVPPYLPESSEIRGIYSTIVDANNAVRRLANDYDEPEEPSMALMTTAESTGRPAMWAREKEPRFAFRPGRSCLQDPSKNVSS
jgi:hypothetical protein